MQNYKAYLYKDKTTSFDVTTLLPLTTIKSWLKLSSGNTSLDTELTMLADMARITAEENSWQIFGKRTFETYRDGFFEHRHGLQWDFKLRKAPFLSLTSIKYLDTNKVLQTLDSSLYEVIEEQNYTSIVFPDYNALPDVYDFVNSVVITFDAGFEIIPNDIKNAMLSHIASAWINRGDCQDDKYTNVPANSLSIYRSYKPKNIGV